MASILTWGTFAFDDTEVTSLEIEVGNTEYIRVPKIVGYPAVQRVGDTLGKASVGLRFSGATAKARLSALQNFGIGAIAELKLQADSLGYFYQTGLNVNYQLLLGNDLVAIAVKLSLDQDP